MTKNISRALGTILVLLNIAYFIPLTFKIVKSGGGAFGYGLLLLPITIVTHMFLVPAILTWTNKDKSQNGFLVTNSLGTIWTIFWATFFLTTPK
jgi:hypothetical protein